MVTIETTVEIAEDGSLSLKVPGVRPGSHHIVVVLDERENESAGKRSPEDQAASSLDWPSVDVEGRPAGMPLTREEIYDDDGR